MCTADMATMVHSDTCSLLNGETPGKTKKSRKTKGSYPDPGETIENNKKKQKNKDLSNPGRHLTLATAFSPTIAKIDDFGHHLNI